MEQADFNRLARGDGLIVAHNSGVQYAVVHHWSPYGDLFVIKWRARSKSWTTTAIRTGLAEVVRRADAGEYKTAAIPPKVWGAVTKRRLRRRR